MRVHGVQVAVLQVFVNLAVNRVGAALHNRVEDAARSAAKLRRELVLQQRKLTDGFVGDIDKRSRVVVVVIADAVQVEGVIVGTLAGDGRAKTLADAARRGDAGAKQREIVHARARSRLRKLQHFVGC